MLNIFIVFSISGLWHDASWTFVIWGVLHGTIYLFEKMIGKTFNMAPKSGLKIVNIIKVIKTFSLVTIFWIFFRSQSLNKTAIIFKSIFSNTGTNDDFLITPLILILFFIFLFSDILLFNNRYDKWCSSKPLYLRWFTYALLMFSIITLSGVEFIPFIYFQF